MRQCQSFAPSFSLLSLTFLFSPLGVFHLLSFLCCTFSVRYPPPPPPFPNLTVQKVQEQHEAEIISLQRLRRCPLSAILRTHTHIHTHTVFPLSYIHSHCHTQTCS